MGLPIAIFSFTCQGLSVAFTDSSLNVPTSWNWDFGDSSNSNSQNPNHTYGAVGLYTIVLTVTNTFGSTTYSYPIIVSPNPVTNYTIRKMVEASLPSGITIDDKDFLNLLIKWQLFLQPLTITPVADADVFNEVKWPSLVNYLIAKLLVYDFIEKSMVSTALSLRNITSIAQGLSTPITNTTTSVADYSGAYSDTLYFPSNGNNTLTITSLLVNGVPQITTPIVEHTTQALLSTLNSLGIGTFSYDSVNHKLVSLGNSNIITTIGLTSTLSNIGSFTITFASTNIRVVAISSSVPAANTSKLTGLVKRLETGPSNSEWFDPANFWYKITSKDGLMDILKLEICQMASRSRIRLAMCPPLVQPLPGFIIAKNC